MHIVTESSTVFILALFDKEGTVIDSGRFRNWGHANSVGKRFLKDGECASFKVIQKSVPVHGITISVEHW